MKLKSVGILILYTTLMLMYSCTLSDNKEGTPVFQAQTRTMLGRTPSKNMGESILTPTATIPIILTSPPSLFTSTPTQRISTISLDNSYQKILELLSTNDFCDFPCWWGFIPGITKVDEFNQFLDEIAKASIGGPSFDTVKGHGYVRFEIPQPGEKFLRLSISYEGQRNILEYLWVTSNIIQKYDDGIKIYWGDFPFTNITQEYDLPNILQKYGEPTNVYLFSYRNVPIQDPLTISIVLFYAKKGFFVEYDANGELIKNQIIACPSKGYIGFGFWDPLKTLSFTTIISKIEGSYYPWKTIEDSTGMSVGTFFTSFNEVNNQKCIVTPQEIWPLPGTINP